MWAIEFEEPEGGSRTLEAARPDPARTPWLGCFDDRQACAGTDVGNSSPRAGWEYLHLAIGDHSRLCLPGGCAGDRAM
jgi:hypothetical protein